MYVNIILEDTELLIPLLEDTSENSPVEPKRGLQLSWPAFRTGYFWGGDGETLLRMDIRDVGVQANLESQSNCQVSFTGVEGSVALTRLSQVKASKYIMEPRAGDSASL